MAGAGDETHKRIFALFLSLSRAGPLVSPPFCTPNTVFNTLWNALSAKYLISTKGSTGPEPYVLKAQKVPSHICIWPSAAPPTQPFTAPIFFSSAFWHALSIQNIKNTCCLLCWKSMSTSVACTLFKAVFQGLPGLWGSSQCGKRHLPDGLSNISAYLGISLQLPIWVSRVTCLFGRLG